MRILNFTFLGLVSFPALADQAHMDKWVGHKLITYMLQSKNSNGLEAMEGTFHFRDSFGQSDECVIQISSDEAQDIRGIKIIKGNFKGCEKYFTSPIGQPSPEPLFANIAAGANGPPHRIKENNEGCTKAYSIPPM